MGTDIHMMAEVLVTDYSLPLGNGEYGEKWRRVQAPVFDSEYYRKYEPITIDNIPYTSVPYSGRNYDLFAVLADVRNGRGFAGVKTGDEVEIIAEPRGVPDDASKAWKKYVSKWGVDLHSCSYFTLAELDEALPLLKQHQRKTGVISEDEYLRIKREGGVPQSWSGGIAGGGIRVVTVDEYEAGERAEGEDAAAPVMAMGAGTLDITVNSLMSRTKTYIQYNWETTLEDATRQFIENTMEGLRRIAPRGPWPSELSNRDVWDLRAAARESETMFVDPRPVLTDKVRIVFGFDN